MLENPIVQKVVTSIVSLIVLIMVLLSACTPTQKKAPQMPNTIRAYSMDKDHIKVIYTSLFAGDFHKGDTTIHMDVVVKVDSVYYTELPE